MGEALEWLARLLALLPDIVALWEAVDASDPHAELEAQASLVRAIKDRQMRESLGL